MNPIFVFQIKFTKEKALYQIGTGLLVNHNIHFRIARSFSESAFFV